MSSAIHDAMVMMFAHSKDIMTTAELQGLSMLTEQAVDEARRLGQLCESIGMLIAADSADGVGAGSLQCGDDVADLLYSLSHGFDTIAGMVRVGEMAGGVLRRRAKA